MGFLEGKVVLITGVGAGLGREVASVVLREGGVTALGDIDVETTRGIASELDPSGERTIVEKVDLRDEASIEALVAATSCKWGRIDGVVQVAAFTAGSDRLQDGAIENWAVMSDINVAGNLRVARAVTPALKKFGGAIIFIGSASAVIPADNPPLTSYGISKGALITATHYLARELGPDLIRVNNVAPSWKWGPVVEQGIDEWAEGSGASREEILEPIIAQFALPRMATDQDVANSAAFLVSDLAQNITGQTLYVDAGHYLH